MAIPHAQPGELIDLRPLGDRLAESRTTVLIKTETLEVIRLVLPAGKELPEHRARGPITVQGLEGRVAFQTGETSCELTAGTLISLLPGQPHALQALEDSSLLLTIVLGEKPVPGAK